MDTEPLTDKLNRRAIFEKVRHNHDLLDHCPKHDFSIDLTPSQGLNKKWQCVYCQGEIDAIEKHWYEKGRQHEQERKDSRKQVSDLILNPDDSGIEYEPTSSIESIDGKTLFYIGSPLAATTYKISIEIEEV